MKNLLSHGNNYELCIMNYELFINFAASYETKIHPIICRVAADNA